jgi:hypothetical protein
VSEYVLTPEDEAMIEDVIAQAKEAGVSEDAIASVIRQEFQEADQFTPSVACGKLFHLIRQRWPRRPADESPFAVDPA